MHNNTRHKQHLRKQIQQELRQLPADYIQHASKKITDQILERYFNLHEIWFLFIPLSTEVQLKALINELRAHNKTVCIPHINEQNVMHTVIYTPEDETKTQRSTRGFYQHAKPQYYNGDIDIVITPGMAYDRQNNRLGRGGGRYDKFFQIQKNAQKCGVCFREQYLNVVPIEPHDIKVDTVITN